jgi:hypothetical protein
MSNTFPSSYICAICHDDGPRFRQMIRPATPLCNVRAVCSSCELHVLVPMRAPDGWAAVLRELEQAQEWARDHSMARVMAPCVLMLDRVAFGKLFDMPDGPYCWEAPDVTESA